MQTNFYTTLLFYTLCPLCIGVLSLAGYLFYVNKVRGHRRH
jgi:hypothetical protein